MYINRHIENLILEASGSYPVIMVCGQRQVGKSTMLYHIREKSRAYVTLDDANARRLAKEDAALFFESFGFPILIDEIQRVPELLLEKKRLLIFGRLAERERPGSSGLPAPRNSK